MRTKTILITFAVLTYSIAANSSSSKNVSNQPFTDIELYDRVGDSDMSVERTLGLKGFHGVSVSGSVDIHYTRAARIKSWRKAANTALKPLRYQ